jgi:hypothetical protein
MVTNSRRRSVVSQVVTVQTDLPLNIPSHNQGLMRFVVTIVVVKMAVKRTIVAITHEVTKHRATTNPVQKVPTIVHKAAVVRKVTAARKAALDQMRTKAKGKIDLLNVHNKALVNSKA